MKTSTKILVLAAAVLSLAAGALLGGVLTEGGDGSAQPPQSAAAVHAAADGALTGFGAGSSAEVGRLEAAVRERPNDVTALTQLGFAYQQRWRETADASYLPRAG